MSHELPSVSPGRGVERSAFRPEDFTPEEWERRLQQQRTMEENSVALGGIRFRNRLEQAREKKVSSEVGAARKLLLGALNDVESVLGEFLETSLGTWDPEQGKRVGGVRGRRHSLVSWVDRVEKAQNKGKDPKKRQPYDVAGAAYIVLKDILDHIHYRVDFSAAATSLATKLRDEVRYRRFWEQAPAIFQYKMDGFSTGNYAHMSKSLDASMRYAGVDTSDLEMPASQRELIGTKLIEMVISATKLVRVELDGKVVYSAKSGVTKRSRLKLVPDPDTLEWLNRRNDKLELLQTVHMPMVVPPLAWSKGDRGGYRFALRVRDRYSFIRQGHDGTGVDTDELDLPIPYEAVNRVQETPFRINLKVLELVEKIEAAGGSRTHKHERAGIPAQNKFPDPVAPKVWPEDPEARKDDPDFKQWKREVALNHEKNYRRDMAVATFQRTLDAAQEVADRSAIWFPWNVDFRGRLYPLADALSPQGDDLQKSLLQFAEGKPLGEDGAYYLAIHGANCLGELPFDPVEVDGEPITKVSKLTLQERNDWIERHTLDIVEVAEDPFGNRWWMDPESVDEPLMFYAFCLEWAGYYEAWKAGRGEEFISHLPVGFDGTCNGLQHFAAIWLDEEGGRNVNVVPTERPQDVYLKVAEAVESRILALAEQDPLAALWLASLLLGRKLVKRPTMTFGYGSRRFGFASQTLEYLQGLPNWREVKAHFSLPRETGKPKNVLRPACALLARIIWESLDDVVVKAKQGMDWFQACAREIVRTGKRVEWTVPITGFPVIQPYTESEKRQIKTMLLGQVIQPVYRVSTGIPEVRKQTNAVSPNIIHSLDAAALMLTVVNCSREQEGMSFMMVHDSYATHAGDAGLLSRVLRESFVQLYTQVDVLEHLAGEFQRQVEGEIPPAPAKGSLDLADVLFSDHFFC